MAQTMPSSALDAPDSAVAHITPEQIERYLDDLRGRGYTADTLKSYRSNLWYFYHDLPESKALDRATVSRWRDALLAEGYLPATVNQRLSTVNSFLEHLNLRECQTTQLLDVPQRIQPQITRSEYLRLLSAARMQGSARAYLLVKTFVVLGLTIHSLPCLTAEAVQQGQLILCAEKDSRQTLTIPHGLQQELLEYLRYKGIRSGPVFITSKGNCLNRSFITKCIQDLAKDAQVAPEKCNPRCLRKLCQATREGIRENMALLLEQAYERLLESEQLTTGWLESDSFAAALSESAITVTCGRGNKK